MSPAGCTATSKRSSRCSLSTRVSAVTSGSCSTATSTGSTSAPKVLCASTNACSRFDAIRGNVETELAGDRDDAGDAGCGCAYPDWVGDDVVTRSNQIMLRLRDTARRFPALRDSLLALPMWMRVDVGGARVGIVHGDAQSLAGWGFAQEHLLDPGHQRVVRGWFAQAQVDIFASSHTCLPVFQALPAGDAARAPIVLNNGAAGMPNFAGTQEGLVTRIATHAFDGPERRFGVEHSGLFLDALALRLRCGALATRVPCAMAAGQRGA